MNHFSFGQTHQKVKVKTAALAGQYLFGGKHKVVHGSRFFTVFPETDTTILFYFEYYRGEPSYGMGELFGRLTLKTNNEFIYSRSDSTSEGCKFICTFKFGTCNIEMMEEQYDCGFGYSGSLAGHYRRASKKIPKYFIVQTGRKLYFKSTLPETWESQ